MSTYKNITTGKPDIMTGNEKGPYVVAVTPTILESFDETDLVSDDYTVLSEDTIAGFGIHNNNATNSLTFVIDGVSITVGPSLSWYHPYDPFTSVTVTGTSLDFDAFIDGYK